MKELFDEKMFPSLGRIGRGQFAQIHRCSQPVEGKAPSILNEADNHMCCGVHASSQYVDRSNSAVSFSILAQVGCTHLTQVDSSLAGPLLCCPLFSCEVLPVVNLELMKMG